MSYSHSDISQILLNTTETCAGHGVAILCTTKSTTLILQHNGNGFSQNTHASNTPTNFQRIFDFGKCKVLRISFVLSQFFPLHQCDYTSTSAAFATRPITGPCHNAPFPLLSAQPRNLTSSPQQNFANAHLTNLAEN